MPESTTIGAVPAAVAVPCPLCGGADGIRPVCRVTRWSAPLDIARCVECGLLHVNPRLPDEHVDRYYDADYYGGKAEWSYADERTREPQVRARAAGRLAALERRLDAAGIATRRLVEIGSAFGVFLDEARRRGWEVQGCEISDHAAAHAEDAFGLCIHRCDLADAALASGSADVVTGSEVVEHLSRPMETLRAAHAALRPGGIALFSTANESSVARLLRGSRWGYFMPGHIVLWSARTLGDALRRAGLESIDVTAGDERGRAAFAAFRRAGGEISWPSWLLRRLRIGGWTLAAGMVVSARKPRIAGASP